MNSICRRTSWAALTYCAITVVASSGTAMAEQSKHPGQWACQMTYTDLDAQGNRTSGFTREYMLAIQPDGMFEAQGTTSGAAGNHQFYSQGQWQAQGDDLSAQGMEQSDDPYAIPGMMFVFAGTLQPDGTMAYRYEQPDPNQQYIMNRTLYYCERRG
jgi:hypothetical protein